jgi:predicted dehydrogenase
MASGTRANFMHQGLIAFEDTGSAILQMSSGAIGSINYTINAHKSNMEGSFTLFAENGTLKIGGQYLNELEYFSVDGMERPELPAGSPANAYGHYQGSMSNHGIVYEHFLRAIDDGEHGLMDSAETRKTVAIIEKIYQSSPLLH